MRRGLFFGLIVSLMVGGSSIYRAQTPPAQSPPAAQSQPAQPPPGQTQPTQAQSATGQPSPGQPQGQPGTAAGQGTGAGQIPPISFKTEVNYVEVDALVTDDRGNFARALTKDDFEVLEDGKPQKVELFTEVNIPVERPERLLFANRVIPPDTKTNRDPFAGRLYVIVLDDLHTNALRSSLVKRAAHQFIDKNLGANDLAAVVTTSGRSDASQEFTNDFALLNRAVDKFIGQKLRSRTLERLDEYNRGRSTAVPSSDGTSSSQQQKILDPLDFERGYQARNALLTLKNLANYLSGIHGRRKALLFFSEGIDYPIYDVFDSRDATDIIYQTREAITSAARANVNFYTIDPQGLIGLPGEAIELTSPAEDPGLRLSQQGMEDEVRLAQDSLRTLAEETGGIALVNSNDFANGFDKIVKANSSYYVLGYYPPETKRDGRFHKIQVKVKKPGLKVSARKGYASPKGKSQADKDAEKDAGKEKGGDVQTSSQLRDVLNSPLQQSGVGMVVQAAAFKGSAPNASIALSIEIDAERMTFKPEKNLFMNKLELSFYPVTDQGKPLKGTRSELDLKLREQTLQQMRAFGVRVNPRIDLPPGRYQVRIGAREAGGGEVGSVFYDLTVPDFAKEKLTMSDILLTAATAKFVPTPMADKQVEGVLPLPATARREFVNVDTLALFCEVYDNLPPLPAHKIDITTKLITDDGREVFKTNEERASSELQGSKGGGYGHTLQIPLKDVAPGLYLLRVEAASRLKDVNTVSKEMLIRVHPMPVENRGPAPQAPPAAKPPSSPQPPAGARP
jgi:VWFA-related protein